MKIALISIHYPPLRSSCAIQMSDLAQEFLQQGHEPIVIVPTEGGEKSWASETINGVKVYRLVALKTIDVGYFRRAINEILLPFTMLYGLCKSDFPINGLDAVVWYSPTIFFGPLIWALKRSSQCPAYLILRDIFPEWAVDLGILRKGLVYYVFKVAAQVQYFVADIIGVQTKSNLKYLLDWNRKPHRRLEVLNNWLSNAPISETSILISSTPLKSRKIFVYIGNMGIAQGMDVLIDLAKALKFRKDIGFLFVGRGSEVNRLQILKEKFDLDNIIFHDEIESKEIPGLLEQCDVGLIALDSRHKSHNIPGKFLTYMQAGLPILASVNAGTDLSRLIISEDVGRVYEGHDINFFFRDAEELVDNDMSYQIMSEQGKNLSQKMFSSEQAVKQIVTALNENRLSE